MVPEPESDPVPAKPSDLPPSTETSPTDASPRDSRIGGGPFHRRARQLFADLPTKAAQIRAWPPLRRMLKASWPFRGILAISMSCAALWAGAQYVRAYLARPLLDDILVPGATMDGATAMELFQPRLLELGAIAALTVIATPFLFFGKTYYAGSAVFQLRRDLDQALSRKFLRIPLAHHRNVSSGDLLARAMSDLHLATAALVVIFSEVARDVLMCVVGLITMYVTSAHLTFLTILTVPPLLLLLNFFGRRIQRQTQKRQETQGDLSHRLIGILSGIKVIKAFRGYAVEEAAYARETERFFKRSMKVLWNQVMAKSSTSALTQIVGFVILAFGAWLVLSKVGNVTIGTLTAFAIILMTTYKPVKSLIASYTKVMESTAAATRLFQLLDADEEVSDRPGAVPMTGLRHGIQFKDVHFGYGDEKVLNGIDLEVSPGEVVAVVGRTGAGKSTLLDLLVRFHDPHQRIDLDRRGRSARPRAQLFPRSPRRRDPGTLSLRHDDPREHSLRPTRRDARGSPRRRRRRPGRRVHRSTPRRLRHARRRIRAAPLRRPTPAHHHRARDPSRSRHPGLR